MLGAEEGCCGGGRHSRGEDKSLHAALSGGWCDCGGETEHVAVLEVIYARSRLSGCHPLPACASQLACRWPRPLTSECPASSKSCWTCAPMLARETCSRQAQLGGSVASLADCLCLNGRVQLHQQGIMCMLQLLCSEPNNPCHPPHQCRLSRVLLLLPRCCSPLPA